MLNYRLRVSHWARGLILRVTADAQVEIVAPRRVGPRTIARVLQQHRAWIAAAVADAEARRRARPPATLRIPEEIILSAIAARWPIRLSPTTARGARISTDEGRLILSGQVADPAVCRHALRRWLVRQGRQHLAPWLDAVSRAHGLPYGRCAVRLTRSQWGCCYRNGLITLSARLLFAPPPVVDYVLIHELCHTRHPNHSSAFWALVNRYCPECQQRRAELRRMDAAMPGWVIDR